MAISTVIAALSLSAALLAVANAAILQATPGFCNALGMEGQRTILFSADPGAFIGVGEYTATNATRALEG